MFNKKLLKAVLAIQSKSNGNGDELMLNYLASELSKINKLSPITSQVDEYGNIYVTKGDAEIYPCCVAHTDTVHNIRKGFVVVEVDDAFFAWDNVKREQAGVGGDDKVGIYICLQALRDMENLKVVFFRNEEVGCLGSKAVHMDFFDDVSFILQADRKGSSDFIDYSNGVDLFDDEFKSGTKAILDMYGYKCEHGIATDVGQLKNNKLNVAAANVSCGYYNAHSDREYVVIGEVENCYNLFLELFNQLGDRKWVHEHVEKPVTTYGSYNGYRGGGSYGGGGFQSNRQPGHAWDPIKYQYAPPATPAPLKSDKGNWGYTGSYDYAANGHDYDYAGQKWVYNKEKAEQIRKDRIARANEPDASSKKKEQTQQVEVVGQIATPKSQTSLILSPGDESSLIDLVTEAAYRIAQAKIGMGIAVFATCPNCDARADMYTDGWNSLICSSCVQFTSDSEITPLIDYGRDIEMFELQESTIYEHNKFNHFCSCTMECVSGEFWSEECQSCLRH